MNSEPTIRIGIFVTILILLIIWERISPRRPAKWPRTGRWLKNSGFLVIDTSLVRLLFPTAAVGTAVYAQTQDTGLFNHANIPWILHVVGSVLVLDLVIYWQHRFFHKFPWLWRIHRLHHSDLDVDLSSGVRFHPFEILLSLLIKIVVILVFGLSVTGVLIFEIMLNAGSLFIHSNIRVPLKMDHWLRCLIVTPDMHRIHHSTLRRETDSNFSTVLSCWDRIFKSYCATPHKPQETLPLGLHEYPQPLSFRRMLTLPFIKSSVTSSK